MYIADSRATTKHLFFPTGSTVAVLQRDTGVFGAWASTGGAGTGRAVPPGAEGRRGGDRRGNRGSETDTRGGREEGTLRGQGARRGCGPGRSRAAARGPSSLAPGPALLRTLPGLDSVVAGGQGAPDLPCLGPRQDGEVWGREIPGKAQMVTRPRSQYPGAARRLFVFLGFTSPPPLGGSGA